MSVATASWHERARALRLPAAAFIDGAPVEARATFPSVNPATGAVLADVARRLRGLKTTWFKLG